MTAETKRFLAVRFVVMVAWAALIVGAFALSVVIGDRVDPDGRLRAAVAALGADAEDH